MIRSIVLGSVLMTCAACVPVENNRGYLPDADAIKSVSIGKDTKATIKERLGDPTTAATFSNDVWYYISSKEQQVAFFNPTIQSRDILAIEFDKDGQVADIHHYGLNDGQVVDFVSRETPTKGKELTFLQQLFYAVPGAAAAADKEGAPGSGGSPGGGGRGGGGYPGGGGP